MGDSTGDSRWRLLGELRMYQRGVVALTVAAVAAAIVASLWVGLTYANNQARIASSSATAPERSCAEVGYEADTCDAWLEGTRQGRLRALEVASRVGGAGASARTTLGAVGFASGHGLGLAGLLLSVGLASLSIGGERAAGVDRLRWALRTRRGIVIRFVALSMVTVVAILAAAAAVAVVARIHPWDLDIAADYRSSPGFAIRRTSAVILWIGLLSAIASSAFMNVQSRSSAFLVGLWAGAGVAALSALPGIGAWTPYGLIRSISRFEYEPAFFDTLQPFESHPTTTPVALLVLLLALQLAGVWAVCSVAIHSRTTT